MKKMEDIFDVARGGSPRPIDDFLTDQADGINWIMIGDTKVGGKYIEKTAKKIKPEGVSKSRVVKEGDFLLTNSMSFGRPYILKTRGCIHDGWLVLSPLSDQINTDYFYYYLGSDEMKMRLSAKAAGAVVKNLNKDIVKSLKIPLPPLATQKKIAAILDAADAHRQKTKQLLAKYDELAQSIFLDMFGDPVTNPKGWEVGEIADLVSEVKYGTSSKAKDGGELEYLRMNNITYKGDMDYSKLKYIDLTTQELKKYTTKKYDLLFNRTNSKELVGKTGIVLDDKTRAIAGYLIRIRLNEKGNPFFVWAHLNSKWAKLTLENMCKNIVGMANINAKELQKIKTLVPPRKVQDAFEIRLKSINNQKTNLINSLNCSENLFNSLLQKAFKGELVK